MKPAVIYARVSTNEQANSRLGIESQLRLCSEFMTRNGYYAVAGSIVDDGVSASIPLLDRRKGHLITAHHDSTIIALCQDRLFRSVLDMLVTAERLAESNISVALVDEGILDLEDDDRWLGAMMRCVFAELERRRGAKRTSRAMDAKRGRGIKPGDPYGWRTLEGVQCPDAVEQGVIAEMIALNDGRSLREIARLINDRGHRTRDGFEFSHVQVKRIIDRMTEE